MDYKEIINKGKLVYASRSTDSNFRLWRLNKTACYVTYYKTVELTKLDKVLLMTIKYNGGSIYENKLAGILGFNVQDDFDVTPKRYKDVGEVSIFGGILSELTKFALISNVDHKVSVTPLGELALKKGVKYEFYLGAQLLNECFDLAQKTEKEFLYFPFRDSLGIVSKIQGSKLLPYEDFNVGSIEEELYGAPEELVSRLLLQSDDSTSVFRAEASTDARMGESYVDFRLYEYNDQKYPIVFYQNEVSLKANDLLFNDCNTQYVRDKIHIGEYLYLVRESRMRLSYQSLYPYMDVWSLDDFLDSEYLDWNDKRLFDSIAKVANGAQWSKISSVCPTESLKPNLKQYEESLDWIIISERFDDDFIVENATKYPWDFESLSASRSIDFVKRIIVIPELHNDTIDWDWETLMPQLEDEFVLQYIDTIPFVMYSQTEKYLSLHPESICTYPDHKWDWKFLSLNAELGYILDNTSAIGKYIYVEDVMPRAFSDGSWVHSYCESSAFAFAVIESKERLATNYNANNADYQWSIELIDWHEKMGFVTWKSTNYAVGLECNSNIVWNSEFFEHYKEKDFSVKGLNHISASVTDCHIVDSNIDFKWSWSQLSRRDIVLNDIEFITKHLTFLALDVVIANLREEYVDQLYVDSTFKTIASAKELWPLVTEKVSEGIIRKNFNDEKWDWKVLTKRFCDTMHITQLGDARWVDKLDWDYLSEHLDIVKIQDNLSLYVDRWNWKCITSRAEHDFLLSNLPEYYDSWDWESLLQTILTDEDLADENIRIQIAIILSQIEDNTQLWALFTKRYSTEDIIALQSNLSLRAVRFDWNYSDVYNRSDFEIEQYLQDYQEHGIYVDWDALSSSKALDRILRWDKNITKDFNNWEDLVVSILENEDYDWNFKYLSTLTSINWCDNILRIRSEEWDWDYLSENSKCFSYNSKRPKELIKHIEKFDEWLNFALLSKRKDVRLDVETISAHLSYPWDWNAISQNKSFALTAEFVMEHKDLDWEWSALSSRNDCLFTAEFIKDNKEKDWNWAFLSKRKEIVLNTDTLIALVTKAWDWNELIRRKDIEFTPDLLRLIIDKDLNWKAISQRDDFYPTLEVLNILKDKNIDWSQISRREELAANVILVFKDKLDWKILSHSSHINISDARVLDRYKSYLDWNFVSNSPNLSLTEEVLEKFKDYLNWIVVCRRTDFIITAEILEKFETKLDWSRISRTGNIEFTQEIVDKYRDRWDWVALSENPAFRASGVESSFKKELNLMEFYNELKSNCHGRPYVYHFTHMFNAIEVIRTRKILSRNRANELGLLKYDAAGSVVHRSSKAHPYARFYYRTGTQTQFYNECLGKQRNTKYYQSALGNGLPMCPMPVFFKFDLQEVLSKRASLCSYSTGNLQANWANVYKVIDDPYKIDAVHLYSHNNYDKVVRDKKQQEFLVKNEFDFSDINDYQIICYDREETEILRSIFKDDPICEHIFSIYEAEDVFEHENPQLLFDMENGELSIKTRYNGDYIFQIESNNITKVKVHNTKDIKAEKKNIIQLYDAVSVELGDTPFEVYYVNMSPAARSPRWLVYKHEPVVREVRYTRTEDIEKYLGISFDDEEFSPEELITAIEIAMPKLEELYNTKVRHYVVKQHTLLVCQQFEKYAFELNTKVMNIDLMRLVLAMHDIGKAIDRATQHTHTLSLIREFWSETPFTDYELKLVEVLLKDDHLGNFFQGRYDCSMLQDEIKKDAEELQIDASCLLQLKMVLYQCDIASYTKDAGGLKYLEHMFVYENNEKTFDEENGLLSMSADYWSRYEQLKSVIYE